jgi:hypothetical protein
MPGRPCVKGLKIRKSNIRIDGCIDPANGSDRAYGWMRQPVGGMNRHLIRGIKDSCYDELAFLEIDGKGTYARDCNL